MRVKHAAIVEVDELVLATPADADHATTGNRSTLRRGHSSPERRVVQRELFDATAAEVAAQPNDGPLYFRKFRHTR